MESDAFYGDFTVVKVKLVWRSSGVFIKKHGQSNYQTIIILILS